MIWEKEEFEITYILNKKENINFWKILGLDPTNKYAILVAKKQIFSKKLNKKIYPKSDIIIAEGHILENILEENNFILTYEDINKYWLIPLEKTGISVKKDNSNKYTITKMNPSTFKIIFWNNYLGAWASIYCSKLEELFKNIHVLQWWWVDVTAFVSFFKNKKIDITIDHLINPTVQSLQIFKQIKQLSNIEIKDIIENSSDIKDFIFKGDHNDPYCCSWIYSNKELINDVYIPYTITTWSWRTKWDFTIVIKPNLTK